MLTRPFTWILFLVLSFCGGLPAQQLTEDPWWAKAAVGFGDDIFLLLNSRDNIRLQKRDSQGQVVLDRLISKTPGIWDSEMRLIQMAPNRLLFANYFLHQRADSQRVGAVSCRMIDTLGQELAVDTIQGGLWRVFDKVLADGQGGAWLILEVHPDFQDNIVAMEIWHFNSEGQAQRLGFLHREYGYRSLLPVPLQDGALKIYVHDQHDDDTSRVEVMTWKKGMAKPDVRKAFQITHSHDWQSLATCRNGEFVLFGDRVVEKERQYTLEGWTSKGQRKWQTVLSRGAPTRLNGWEELSNGNWCVALDSIYIVSSEGEVLFKRHYGFARYDNVVEILPHADGGYSLLIQQQKDLKRNIPLQYWLLSADAQGNEVRRTRIE